MDGPEEIAIVEAQLVPTAAADEALANADYCGDQPASPHGLREPVAQVEQQTLPIPGVVADPETPTETDEPKPAPRAASPYAQGL
jgi:hypothetical protein